MEFKLSGIVLFIIATIIVINATKNSQKKDKRYNKGVKNKITSVVILKLTISIILFYMSYKLITI